MGLSDLYYKLEEKYYASLDWFDSKGIHFFYNFDAWLQSKNIPSFPIMTLLLLIFIAAVVLLILYFLGVFASGVTANLQLINSQDNYAIPNLSFTVNDGITTKEYITDSRGEARVRVKSEVSFYVNVNSSEYVVQNGTFTVYENNELVQVYLKSSSALLSSKTLKLFEDYDASILFQDAVSVGLKCTNNSNYSKTIDILSGVRDLSDLPEDCGSLEVSIQEYDFYQSFNLSNHEFEVPVNVKVPKGKVKISVLNVNQEPLSNVKIGAYSNSILVEESITSESGVVEFNLAAKREYSFILNHLGQEYSTLITSGMQTECNGPLLENETKSCTLTMLANNIGKINLEIYDVSGSYIKNASVRIFKNNIEYYSYTLTESDKGIFIYNVPELTPYRVVIDSLAYMIYDKEILPSNTAVKINLEPIKESPVLQVLVLANEDPVARANVQLFKEGNLILTKVTGADGIAFFDRLEQNVAYNVKVQKSDYAQNSEPLILNPRIENKITVNLVVGKGTVNVYGFDKKLLGLDGLTAEVYDLYTDRKLGQAQLKDGLATIYGISADKTIYAKIVSESGAGYSLSSNITANYNTDLYVYFNDYSNNFSIENIGVFNLDGSSIYTSPYQVMENNEYYGLFLLNVPKGAFTESEVLFVGGNTLENSNILIKSAKMLNANLQKGLTYTSPLGYAEDMLNKTQDDAVWAHLKSTKVQAGTYLVRVDFVVNSNPRSQLFNLGYRASLKSGASYLRFPVDSVLGQSESSNEKLGFYAELARNVNFRLGSLNCINSGCIEMSAVDAQGNRTKVYDELYSLYNLSTDLTFKIISAQKTNYDNLNFEVVSLNNGLNISNFNLRSNNSNLIVQKTGNKFVAKLNEFGPNVELNGNINFLATKSGVNILKLTIYNNQNEEIFTKEISVSVDAPNDLRVEYLPSVIVPYVKNLGGIFVTDLSANPLEGAFVTAYLNDVLISSGTTDYEGKYPLEIQKPNSGDILKLKASAPGFNEAVSEIKITENVLLPDVPEITYNINIDELDYMLKTITFTTPLVNKLKIQRIGFTNNEFSKFIEVKHNLRANYEFEKTLSLELSAKLTDLGKNLLEPKAINTNLDLIVTSDEINKSWNVKVPVTFYIKMYDSLDTSDCLKLDVLSDVEGENEYGFKLINTCSYNESATDLYNLKIFAEWDGAKLGEFEYNNKILDSEGLDLFEFIGKNNTFNLKFKPSSKISSGTSKTNFIVKAYYRTNSGLQELTAEKKIDIIYSKLSTCLKITTAEGMLISSLGTNTPIMIGVSPYGMGMNSLSSLYNPMLSGMAGMAGMQGMAGLGGISGLPTTSIMPQTTGSLWDQYSRTSNTLGQYSNAAGLSGLYSGINSGLGLQGMGSNSQLLLMQQMMGMSYGGMNSQMYLSPTSVLTVTNTCAYDVDLQIGANAQIMVSPNTSTIAKGSNTQVTIMANSLPGVYTVNILAGYNGNLNPYATLPVNVIDYASETVQDNCFKIEGEPTIDMSSFTKQHKQLKIYNYCFSKGVVFDDYNPVSLVSLFAEDVYQTVNGKKIKVASNGNEYANIRVIKSPQIENSNTYGRYQYIEIMILKSNAVQEVAYKNYAGTSTLSNTAQSLSVLRGAATALENNVNFKALITINSRIGYGMAAQGKSVVKIVTIRDLWNLLALAGAGELDAGNRTCIPDKWDAKITKDLSYKIKFSQLENNSRIPLNNEKWDLLDSNCFGSFDDVKFDDEYLEKTNNGITVKLTPKFDNRKLYFDIDVEGSGAKFEATYDFGFVLSSYWHSEAPLQKRTKNLKFKLTITDVDAGEPKETSTSVKEDNFCSDKFGSEWKSLNTYGFGSLEGFNNMLSFDYSNVDCSKVFCDAQQLKRYLKDSEYSQNKEISFMNLDQQQYMVRNGSLLELSAKDVLDSLSLYYLEKELDRIISKSDIETTGYTEFNTLAKNMPNMFLKVNGACVNVSGKISVGNTCYYKAIDLIELDMKTIFNNKTFEVVFLVNDAHKIMSELVSGKTRKVYLKPDGYEDYFARAGLLDYSADVFGSVDKAGVYYVYPYVVNEAKKLTILKADSFIKDDAILNKLFYNLVIDPDRGSGYTGTFGLCNSKTAIFLGLTTSYTCSNTKILELNEYKSTNNKYIEFSLNNKELVFSYPKDCEDKVCTITGKNNFSVNTSKDTYKLTEVFNNAGNYCYSESNNNVKVIYSGQQR